MRPLIAPLGIALLLLASVFATSACATLGLGEPDPYDGVDTTGSGPAVIPQERYVQTPSGLRYYDLRPGEGLSPDSTDRVQVHYTGWVQASGRKFDSSRDRGEPNTFVLNRLIDGWTEGLQSMQVGGLRQMVIPSDLAYGERGAGAIPPGATLVFEIELLDVERVPEEPGAAGGAPDDQPR